MSFSKVFLVLALASAMFARSSTVLATGCVEVFGLVNCPLGQANLDVIDGNLVVSNIGASGNDGVSVTLPPGVVLTGFELAAGGSHVTSAIGVVNGVPGQPTGQVLVESISATEKQSTPDFSAIGASTYTLQILDGDVVVYEEAGRSGPATTSIKKTSSECCLLVWYYDEWELTNDFQVVDGPLVSGTQVRYIPENPTGQVQSFNKAEIRAAGISSFTIFNEFATVEVGGPVPTVSEWGLIILTVLGLTAGTVMYGRRRRPAAA
ncbi:MAG: hypothetical protein IH987_15610 [Planctomycetes bacterium]|nr:hypothetical protein [Planctomycetota bacterium]